MVRPGERRGTAITAVVLADVALEVTDALTFAVMALASEPRPQGRQLLSLSALILPRLAFAVLGTLVLRMGLRRGPAAPSLPVAAFLVLVAVQAAAGLFLLWGLGSGLPARTILTTVNVVAAGAVIVAARSRAAAAAAAAAAVEPPVAGPDDGPG